MRNVATADFTAVSNASNNNTTSHATRFARCSNKKYKDWLSASRLSRAPTGRLPTLEEQLSEEQLLELETAKLRLKKERKIAGEAHFKHWLDKKKKEDIKKIEKYIEAEKEELGGEVRVCKEQRGADRDARTWKFDTQQRFASLVAFAFSSLTPF